MNNKIFDLADQLKAAKDKKKELDAQVKELGAEIERFVTSVITMEEYFVFPYRNNNHS